MKCINELWKYLISAVVNAKIIQHSKSNCTNSQK